jgi:hypothetical protein
MASGAAYGFSRAALLRFEEFFLDSSYTQFCFRMFHAPTYGINVLNNRSQMLISIGDFARIDALCLDRVFFVHAFDFQGFDVFEISLRHPSPFGRYAAPHESVQ